MNLTGRWQAAALVLLTTPMLASAQRRLVEPMGFGTSPSYVRWWFSSPVSTDSYLVSGVEQTTVPVSIGISLSRSWRVDLVGAASQSRVRLLDTGSGTEEVVAMDGLTDARFRTVGRLLGERLWVTLGANLPIGRTALRSDELLAARVLGSPALSMQSPVLGRGTGVTAGAVYATPWGSWAVAAGASVEVRTTYTPLEVALFDGAGAEVDLDPGEALQFSLGLDRIVGEGRISLLVTTDVHGRDLVTIRPSGDTGPTQRRYRLGPTFGGTAAYRTQALWARELSLTLRGGYRSEYEDASGGRVIGSSGAILEPVLLATYGRRRGLGFVVEMGGLLYSGLDVDSSLATAAMTAGTLRMGLLVPLGGLSAQLSVRGRFGRLDSGGAATTAGALGVGLSLSRGTM